jgi:GNAT superfamily N-acetyltransferase
MEKELLIRPLSNTYSKQVVDLILPIQQLEFNVPVTLHDQPDLLDIENAYFANGGHFWGGFIGGRLVGTIAIISIGHHSGAVRKMFVKKEFRGKEPGIAQKLFETLAAYSKANNINDLYLGTVNMLKAAHRFYERNGFLRIEKELLPTYFPKMAADDVYYYLHLNNA